MNRAAVGQTGPRDLLRSIFLDEGLRGGSEPGPFPLTKAAGVAAFVLFLTILRKPAPVVIPQFWADDGPAFFQQALESGFGTFLIAHGGYYHTFIRLVALLGTLLPVAFVPHLYLLVAISVQLFVTGYLFSPRVPVRYPTLMALCIGLVPHGGEVYFTLANVNFFFGLLLALFLISDPPVSRRQYAADVLLIAVAGLSGSFSLIYLPLFLWRAARENARPLKVRALLIGVAAALQFTQVLGVRLGAEALRFGPADVLNILGLRLLDPLLAGPLGGSGLPSILLGICAVALLAFVTGILRIERKHKALYLLAAGMSVVASALYVARGVPETLYSVWSQDRFFFVPLVILMWCLVQSLDTKAWMRYVSAALLLIAAVRTVGQPSLTIFEMKDLHWAEASSCIGGPVPCTIPINPPGWYVRYEPRKR